MARIKLYLFTLGCVLISLLSAVGLAVVIKFIIWLMVKS